MAVIAPTTDNDARRVPRGHPRALAGLLAPGKSRASDGRSIRQQRPGPGRSHWGRRNAENDRPFFETLLFSHFFPTFDAPKSKSEKHLFQDYSQCPVPSCTKVWPYTYSQCPPDQMDKANQDPRKQQRINECTSLRRWIVAMFGVSSSPWVVKGGTTPDPVGFDLAWSSLGLLVEGPEISDMSPIHQPFWAFQHFWTIFHVWNPLKSWTLMRPWNPELRFRWKLDSTLRASSTPGCLSSVMEMSWVLDRAPRDAKWKWSNIGDTKKSHFNKNVMHCHVFFYLYTVLYCILYSVYDLFHYLVGGLKHFSISWECHHPNWWFVHHFSEG